MLLPVRKPKFKEVVMEKKSKLDGLDGKFVKWFKELYNEDDFSLHMINKMHLAFITGYNEGWHDGYDAGSDDATTFAQNNVL